MSFVGCIGKLMANFGLKDIMKTAFTGVPKMLIGKKYPENCRALRMIMEVLLGDILNDVNSYDEMIEILEERATRSRTTKIWLDSFIKPVLLLMMYTRAEREADFPLHLWCVDQMIKYFFAADHVNYARCVVMISQMNKKMFQVVLMLILF